jgi:small-conductance mechanosensitive channel
MVYLKRVFAVIVGVVALTQPIRIDDVVIVENEWGKIEEITLTYVVIRIWDKRRLVVPISYFVEKPFQNWTRVSADLLGTVYLYCDYTVPVQAVREELQRILEGSKEWDGEVCSVQVTDATERTMAVRALMSAGDASCMWTLRCRVREKMIDYIRREFPESLPRFRAQLDREGA